MKIEKYFKVTVQQKINRQSCGKRDYTLTAKTTGQAEKKAVRIARNDEIFLTRGKFEIAAIEFCGHIYL